MCDCFDQAQPCFQAEGVEGDLIFTIRVSLTLARAQQISEITTEPVFYAVFFCCTQAFFEGPREKVLLVCCKSWAAIGIVQLSLWPNCVPFGGGGAASDWHLMSQTWVKRAQGVCWDGDSPDCTLRWSCHFPLPIVPIWVCLSFPESQHKPDFLLFPRNEQAWSATASINKRPVF